MENVKFKVEGKFRMEQVRDGKVIDVREGKNIITTEGFLSLLDVMFGTDSKVSAWYIGLVQNSPTYAVGDTLASHAGWTEGVPGTLYTGNRQLWDTDSAGTLAITNSTATEFTILATADVYGAFIASVATGTTGVLWCEKSFASPLSVVATDVIRVYYTVTVAQA